MESYIKIKSSISQMKNKFNNSDSKYYYIKYYSICNNNVEDNNSIAIFDCLIRHNEIGNKSIERTDPYTFESLEKILKDKCDEYEVMQLESDMEL